VNVDIEQCEACAVERDGCPHGGLTPGECFHCRPEKHSRPPCHPLCPKRAQRDAEEAVRKAHEHPTYHNDTYPTARVVEVNGQLVLEDPMAMAVVKAVEKHNCRSTLKMHYERVQHFTRRIAEKGLCVDDWVIVLLNVDDPYGGQLASILMPGHDWQAYRDRGEVPYARGLASREGLQEGLDTLDPEAATKLRETKGETAIIVMDFGVVEVFRAGAPRPAAVMGPDFGDPV
jgi:hypothetical protein